MTRRLYRSYDDRILAGVAGGMAETYDIDPALVRVGWVVLALFSGGLFLIVYIVMALVVPLAPDDRPATGVRGQPWQTVPPPPAGVPPPQAPEGDLITDDTMPAGAVDAEGGTATMPTPPLYMSEREARRWRRDQRRQGSGDMTGTLVIGALLILVGLFFLVRQFLPAIAWGQLWPIVIIGIGVIVLLTALRRNRP